MTVETTPQETAIIKQVEYYFGDFNLSRDEFMKAAIQENHGWVSMDTMMKFNRLTKISDKHDEILDALAKSSSNLIEIGDDRTKIRRNPDIPYPETMRDAMNKYKTQTIYVKGFAAEDTLDELQKFLETTGPTINVHLRRMPRDKKFKGSVFAVYKNMEDAEKFITSDETKVYKEKELIRMWQDDYFKKKTVERDAARAERQKRVEEANAARGSALLAQMVLGALLELTGLPKREEKDDAAEDHFAEDKATLLELKEALRELVTGIATISWLDVYAKEGRAVVRLLAENTAALVLAKITETPFVFREATLTGRVLTGEEEQEKWKEVLTERNKHRNSGGGRGGRGGHGRGGRGGRGGKRGGGGHHGRGPPHKRAKVDE